MSTIASTIEVNGNSAPSDAQINDMAFKAIRALYDEGAELRIMRSYLVAPADPVAKAHFDKYNTDVSVICTDASAAKVVAQNVRAALDFESAEGTIGYWQRFADYMLAPTAPIDPLHLDAYHAAVDPANALISAAPAAVLVLVAQRASYRQQLMSGVPTVPIV